MASRKEQKEKLRQERQAREAAAAAAAARRRRLGYVVAGGLVLAVVVAVIVIAGSSGGNSSSGSTGGGSWPSGSVPKQKISDLDAAAKAAGCVVLHPKDEGRGHTLKIQNYKSQPPSSGAHNPVPAHDAAYLQNPGT